MDSQPQKKFNILLIGDTCVDVYQYGTIDRLSPEAPVPVFVPTYQEERKGMAGNVYANLVALGCTVNLLCGHASKKTRLIDQRSRQQIARIDEDVKSTPMRFETAIPSYDAIVISDYAKGVVDYKLIQDILQEVKCPVFIDTKLIDLEVMQGAWVKINELEYSKIKSECSGLIVTRGSKGAEVIHHNIHCSAPAVEVVDVTGAGDTFLAALAYQYLITNDIESAVEFATHAASITVQHVGVYAPTLEEIQ
jgi:D-beta-D-heptose 7-phosphate kinase/D-beta-D-heptose 1-phosphate adenosyltransferase